MKNNRYQKIIEHYGINNQLKKLSEEVYELQESILEQHNTEHVLEEYADVEVILEQIKQYYYERYKKYGLDKMEPWK